MAITTYLELQDAVSNWLEIDTQPNRIVEFISAGESRIYDDVRIPDVITTSELELDKYANSVTIPAGWLELVSYPIIQNHIYDIATNDFVATNCTITTSTTVEAVNKGAYADSITMSSDTAKKHYITYTYDNSATDTDLSISVYCKAGTGTYGSSIGFIVSNTALGSPTTDFNFTTGVLTDSSATMSSTSTELANDWYKITLEVQTNDDITLDIYVGTADASVNGDGSIVYIWRPAIDQKSLNSRSYLNLVPISEVMESLDRQLTARPTKAAVNGTNLFLNTYADRQYMIKIQYYQREFLSLTNSTSWLLDNYPMVLVYAALVEASIWKQGKTKNVVYEQMYIEQIRRIQRHINRAKHGSWTMPHSRTPLT